MPKRAFSMDQSTSDRLDGISDKRYQGNRSAALRFGMLLLERVAGDPSTATVDPANIDALLAAYCEGRER